MRLTLSDIKASSIPAILGLPSCDPRLLQIVNEAQQRLVMGSEAWWECYQKYRLRTSSGKVTWPRQVANIISVTVDCSPYTIRNEWFEYLESGYGMRTSTSLCGNQIIDRGTACVFDDLDTEDSVKTLKLYASVPEAADLECIIYGYNSDGDWVRTQDDGVWIDGEVIAIPTNFVTPTQSALNWSSITDIIKPVTYGEILLYEYDASTLLQRRIGLYESDETRPRYRRTLIGGLGNGECADDEDVVSHSVTAMVKREHIPVRLDNDFLMVGNLPALKEMAIGIQKRERGSLGEAENHIQQAFSLMEREAAHYIGNSRVVPIRMDTCNWGMADVPCVQ